MKTEPLELEIVAGYVMNAFRIHDEAGFPLELQRIKADETGERISLAAFTCDAFAAGWTEEAVFRVFNAAGYTFDIPKFARQMACLYVLAGCGDGPECYVRMKATLIARLERAKR